MDKLSTDRSIIEKYKLAAKGIQNGTTQKPKANESKKYNKSMEIHSASSKLISKFNNLKAIIKPVNPPQVRKAKSKGSYKPHTTQINLFNSTMNTATVNRSPHKPPQSTYLNKKVNVTANDYVTSCYKRKKVCVLRYFILSLLLISHLGNSE